jgi:HD superfamily phosphohydrolase
MQRATYTTHSPQYRVFNDVIYGHTTKLDIRLWKFIDHPMFQRLRYINQLGTASYTFPCAIHTRFNHSLGVAYLAGKWISKFKKRQPNLVISNHDVFLVQLAGLLHDVGHGPFSHAFEKMFVRTLDPKKYNTKWSHEDASGMIVKYLCNELKMDNKSTEMVINMINGIVPDCEVGAGRSFLYQIVANKKNGLDVDKFDYLTRDTKSIGEETSFSLKRIFLNSKVIDGEICFKNGLEENILSVFYARFNMHRKCYTHKTVVATDMLIGAILNAGLKHFKFDQLFVEGIDYKMFVENYVKLDDTIIRQIELSTDVKLNKARELIKKLRYRKLYKELKRIKVNKADINAKKEELRKEFSGYNLVFQVLNYNMGLKNKNPFEYISFYDKQNRLSKKTDLGFMPRYAEHTYLTVYDKSDATGKDN